MTFTRILGLAGLLIAVPAFAQSGAESAATVTPIEEETPAQVAPLAALDETANPGDIAAGQQKSAVCVACHGIDGNSSDPQYPKLAGQHERYTARQLALYRSGDRSDPIMMGFAAGLSAQDMRDLGAYFASQAGSPGVADESPITSGPNQGRQFFEVGRDLYRGGDAERGIPACMACHGPAGTGNPGPSYPKVAGQHSRYTAQILRAYRDGKVLPGENLGDVMAAIARDLTDEEIDSLSSYIEGLHSAR